MRKDITAYIRFVMDAYAHPQAKAYADSCEFVFIQVPPLPNADKGPAPQMDGLTATRDWRRMLAVAGRKHLSVIVSRVDNSELAYTHEPVLKRRPSAFPGQLLRLLYKRYRIFQGQPESGLTLIFTQLQSTEGDKLLSLILEMAHLNSMDYLFLDWLETANWFCCSEECSKL